MVQTSLSESVPNAVSLALARTERMGGTGASATYRVTGILKVAPDPSETDLLQWLLERLPEYDRVFPKFRRLENVAGRFVTELEYVGDVTLEDLLVKDASDDARRPESAVACVRDLIDRLARQTVPIEARSASREVFFLEIVEAVAVNSRAAGVSIGIDLDSVRRRVRFVPSLCHRDLSGVNVVCAENDGIRLIDPRACVPGASGCSPSYGSTAIDAAAFLVSLERKELERVRMGCSDLRLAERFRSHIDAWVSSDQRFNEVAFDLCMAHAYSVYAACRCEYCLAPAREWLYDLMRRRLEEFARRIA